MKKASTGFIQLGASILVIWLMIFYILPAIVEGIPAFKRYGDEMDRHGLHAGALFYSDLPIINDAELHIRNTIRFLPKDKQ